MLLEMKVMPTKGRTVAPGSIGPAEVSELLPNDGDGSSETPRSASASCMTLGLETP